MLLKLARAIDASDVLVVVGVTSLIGGIAAIHKPSSAIVFGVLCLYVWVSKQRRAT
jgi:hypothetical protein